MEISGAGKSPNTSLAFRYNANNEELEELFQGCEDDPPTPQCEPPPSALSENASPKRGDRTPSIIDKYFKSMRTDKAAEKTEEPKPADTKSASGEDSRATPPKEVSSSPMKEYLNRLGKKSSTDAGGEGKEGSNETWKIFHDFKFKIAQAVEDMKTRSLEETKEKSVPRENSMSDSEENSASKELDQQSVGDTDNQVSSLDSSLQNLSELTQPVTAKAIERELSLPVDNKNSDSSDDTHKNLAHVECEASGDPMDDCSTVEVESGVEALEDGLCGICDPILDQYKSTKPLDIPLPRQPPTPPNFGQPPSKTNLTKAEEKTSSYFLNFTMYFLTFLLLTNYILFPNSNIWNGFLLGIWFFCFASNLKQWLLDNYFSDWEPSRANFLQLKRSGATPVPYVLPSVKEHMPLKKHEGWINHYRYPDYDPYSYHINKTTTAFIKLEGCNLRISYTTMKIAKRALWDEKIEKPIFYQHRLYNLTGARVVLLPKGLVKRRQWSKKYPICIILNDNEKIQVLEKELGVEKKPTETMEKKKEQQLQHEVESTETNTSPEKKKKFIWRRKEKSIIHAEAEVGKEGLRHRIVRKMHRDKKTDTVSTCTDQEPAQVPPSQEKGDKGLATDADTDMETSKSVTSSKEEDEDLEDAEMSRIKEFLEEVELESGPENCAEGEWSVHTKESRDKHSHLYLFARTGRDKHEWFRRLTTAAREACPAEEPSEPDRDDLVFKLSEKGAVAFNKDSTKSVDSTSSEGVTILPSPTQAQPSDTDNYEKNFWPYLIKIMQNKSGGSPCQCRMLPAEVSWVNTVMARIVYDVMRDPVMIARVQNRIQRKLNTLKLPSFMSPLVVTSLSLGSACPLVERVLPPSWDARGVWLDCDLRYDGGAFIALSTQINLMKLKEKNVTLEEQLLSSSYDHVVEREMNTSPSGFLAEHTFKRKKHAVYDSDMEDSAESSSDDESPPVQPVDSADHLPVVDTATTPVATEGSSKKKFLRMVDRIATNKYFQQVTDYKYVKRAMEGLSNTDIKLQLEVVALEGRLALNLPPPPHDRLWIGFRTNPLLVLKARPAVGARALRFAHISNWIEQKLSKEFEKVLVLPNMEDFMVDAMTPTPIHFE